MKWGFQTTDGAPEQFLLSRSDAARFCCVVNKCQTSTSGKLEKCVRSVVFKRAFAEGFKFLLSFEENCCRNISITYGEHAPSQDTCERWLRRFKSGDFKVADKEHGKLPKNSKMWNCRHWWTKMIRKHKNNSLSNWVLVHKVNYANCSCWTKVHWLHK